MRCCNDLVGHGDRTIEVLAKCGEPVYVEERVIYRVRKISRTHPRGSGHGHVQKEKYVPVSIETWIYDFGSNRFMREAWFVDGHLERVRTLGRGFASQSECGDW
jgi:hypothetical protein